MSHGLTNPRFGVFSYTAYRAMPAFTILLVSNCHIAPCLRVPATGIPNKNL